MKKLYVIKRKSDLKVVNICTTKTAATISMGVLTRDRYLYEEWPIDLNLGTAFEMDAKIMEN